MKTRTIKKFNPKSIQKMEYTVILSVLLFMVIFVIASFYAGIEDVWDRFKQLTPSMFISLLGLSFVNYICRGLKWHLFGRKLGFGVPLKRMALYYASGMALTVTPGKIGTGLRLWLLNKCHKIKYSKGLPLMIMDPLTDLASLFILCIVSLVSFGGGHLASLAVFGSIIVSILTILTKPKWFLKIIKLVYLLFGKRKKRAFASLQKMSRNITKLVTPWVFSQTVFFSILGWSASVLAFYHIVISMGGDITFLECMFVFSFATIIGGASMTPGGLGGTEATMIILLLTLGIPNEIAIPATIVIRFVTLWFGVFVGFCFLPFALKLAKHQNT